MRSSKTVIPPRRHRLGGSIAAAAQLVPGVARAFHRRLQLALSGHLHGQPVALPRQLKPGSTGARAEARGAHAPEVRPRHRDHRPQGQLEPQERARPGRPVGLRPHDGAGGLVRPHVTGSDRREQRPRGSVLRRDRDERRRRRPGEDEDDFARPQQRGRQRTRPDVPGIGREATRRTKPSSTSRTARISTFSSSPAPRRSPARACSLAQAAAKRLDAGFGH